MDFFQADKLLHLLAYGILTFLWIYVLNGKGRAQSIRTSLIIAISFGIFLECAQYGFFTGRRFEFLDIIANIMGAVIGEWVGAKSGLGVYMTRAMSSFKTDALFADILIIVVLSIMVFKAIDHLGKKLMPWNN